MLVALAFSVFASSSVSATAQRSARRAEIELSLDHQVLRDQIMVISGRLITSSNFPIALAKIRLQYYRFGETDLNREVVLITSNPGGRFEDRFNTTSLLRVGTWVVNASFPSQFGYESTSTLQTFTIVVQPALSLYLSNNEITLGQSVAFNGLLFACIPCIQDEVVVIVSRPDNTSVSIPLRLTAIGGPYPGGYYNGTFAPDVPGTWHVTAFWKGSEVTLPAHSQVEELHVDSAGTRLDVGMLLFAAMAGAALGVVALTIILRQRRLRKNTS